MVGCSQQQAVGSEPVEHQVRGRPLSSPDQALRTHDQARPIEQAPYEAGFATCRAAGSAVRSRRGCRLFAAGDTHGGLARVSSPTPTWVYRPARPSFFLLCTDGPTLDSA